jgi:1-acyl-sn-glycerol-3-phosphate acyltransferase
MLLLRHVLIVLWTVILGLTAMVLCILVPGGRAFGPPMRLWAHLVLGAAGVRVRVSGAGPSTPCVFIANHQSQLDIPALVRALPSSVRFIAKKELLYVPIFGWALWLAGFVFVDRRDRDKAIRSLETAARRVRAGTPILVFAEGTRSPDGRLLPFKKGGFLLAMQAGVAIVPVTLRGGTEVLPKGSLRIRPGRIEVVIGDPIDTTRYSFETRDALIAAVRGRIEAGLTSSAGAAPRNT